MFINLLHRFLSRYERERRIRPLLSTKSTVLEVGGGNKPYRSSNIVLDKYFAAHKTDRSGSGGIMQHPGNTYVLGDGNNLPFSDNSMDTVICRHVVEHVNDPAHFVNELQRVGKNGYLEWPSIYSELVHGGFGDQEYLAKNINAIDRKIVKKLKHGNGTRGHKWFIVPVEDTLFCVGKVQAIFPLYLIYGRFTKLLQNGSKLGFGCKFPKTSAITWTRQHPVKVEVLTQKDSIIAKSLNNEYRLTDQKKWIARNFANTPECIKELDEYKLRCPSCHRGKLKLQEVDTLHCENCQLSYPVINGVPVLLDNSDV